MTYETGLDGVLLPAVCIQIADQYILRDFLPPALAKSHWGNTVWLGAKAQHQADIEKVKAVFLLLGGHINERDLGRCEEEVLEALGKKE